MKKFIIFLFILCLSISAYAKKSNEEIAKERTVRDTLRVKLSDIGLTEDELEFLTLTKDTVR